MRHPRRVTFALLILFSTSFLLIHADVAQAQNERLCFSVPGISNCIVGRFLQYWRDNGGLPVFGYPITPEYRENTPDGSFIVQYFERNRFELHPEKQPPYDVLLGRLGDDRLRQTEWNWRTDEIPGKQMDECSWWKEVSHAICSPFKEYWESHGLKDPNLDRTSRSLQLFGLPLSEARMETNTSGDTVLTQWFERARFEYHADKGVVLLGLLGNEIQRNSEVPFDVLDYAIVDVDWFWMRVFHQKGWVYYSPLGAVKYNQPIWDDSCEGTLEPDNSYYCSTSQTVYLSTDFLARKQAIGNMAAVTVIAHEWGHHVQNMLGIQNTGDPFERQADCLAGSFAQDADARGLLSDNAINDVQTSFHEDELRGGLSLDTRFKEFMWGYQFGVDACLE